LIRYICVEVYALYKTLSAVPNLTAFLPVFLIEDLEIKDILNSEYIW